MIDRARIVAMADGTDVGTCAAVDMLQTGGATLAEVLLLYAGEPPDWLASTFVEDEGLRLVVVKWCEVTEPNEVAHVGNGPCLRWRAVRACGLGACGPDRNGSPPGARRRDQKRAVLALFPEVTREVRCEVPMDLVGRARHVALGLNPDRAWDAHFKDTWGYARWHYRQTLAAPDWIAPEPVAGDDLTREWLAHVERFRTEQDAADRARLLP